MFIVHVFGLFVNLQRLSSLFLGVLRLCMVLGLSRVKTLTNLNYITFIP